MILYTDGDAITTVPSVVNKDLSFKAKAKAKAKDLT